MRLRRLLLYICAFLLTYLTLRIIKDSSKSKQIPCTVTEETESHVLRLTDQVHNILHGLKVNHFLCYGSLWGALKLNKKLPWDDHVEFCAVNEKIFYLDETQLLRVFRKQNLELEYDWSEGFYTVFNSSKNFGRVEIYLFELDSMTNMFRRVGWKRRVLPPDCDNSLLDCFPPRLVNEPLPLKEFNHLKLPVPNEEIEIQKYLYPDDWWKDSKPPGC